MSYFVDLTGQTFGRLKVIKEAGKNKHGQVMWLTICLNDGNKFVVYGGHLRSGHTMESR